MDLENVKFIEVEFIGMIEKDMISRMELTRKVRWNHAADFYTDFKITLVNGLVINGSTALTFLKIHQYSIEVINL